MFENNENNENNNELINNVTPNDNNENINSSTEEQVPEPVIIEQNEAPVQSAPVINNIPNYNNYNNQSSNVYQTNNPYTTYNYSSFQSNQPVTNKWPKTKKVKKEKSTFKKIVSVVCLGALFGVVAGGAFSVPTYFANQTLLKNKAAFEKEVAESKVTIPATTLTTSTASAPSTSNVSDIVANCLPSVVSITNKGVTEVRSYFGTFRQDTQSSGSGIIIGENDSELLIVTNYHVVSGSNELSVIFSYDEDSENPSLLTAKIKGYDEDKDLAVIAVSSKDVTADMRSKIKIATIGNSSELCLGQEVVAIGNALGYGQSVTCGIISALNREVSVSDDNGRTISNKLIQTDAAINPGNSGGALLNMNGELIGINSVKVASSSVEGMGYAIPISDVQSIIEELMLIEIRDVVDASEQGYIGITGVDVTSEMVQKYDMPAGIYVSTIYADSPAANAGITKGMIISKVDSKAVKSMAQLQELLTHYKAGETVDVVVNVLGADGYEQKTLKVTLGDKKIFKDDLNKQKQDTQTPKEDNSNEGRSYEVPNGEDNYNNWYGNDWFNNFFWPFGTP